MGREYVTIEGLICRLVHEGDPVSEDVKILLDKTYDKRRLTDVLNVKQYLPNHYPPHYLEFDEDMSMLIFAVENDMEGGLEGEYMLVVSGVARILALLGQAEI